MAARKTTKNKIKTKPATRKPRKKRKKKFTVKQWWIILIPLIIIILLFIILPNINFKNAERGAKIPEGNYLFGIDISHNNPDEIKWDSLMVMTDLKLRTVRHISHAIDIQPVKFIFIKASEGVSMRDNNFKKHWEAARKAKLKRGAYHFFRTSKDPEMQAKNFIEAVGPLRGKDLPPVLDIETIHIGFTKKELNENALKWLQIVEEHYKKRPIIYTYSNFAERFLDEEIKNNYPIWIAHYHVDNPAYENWIYWQCSDRAVVHGVPGYVDLNVIRKNNDYLKSL